MLFFYTYWLISRSLFCNTLIRGFKYGIEVDKKICAVIIFWYLFVETLSCICRYNGYYKDTSDDKLTRYMDIVPIINTISIFYQYCSLSVFAMSFLAVCGFVGFEIFLQQKKELSKNV